MPRLFCVAAFILCCFVNDMKAICIFVVLFHLSLASAKAPKLLELPKNLEATLNSSYAITCTALSGSKPIFFEWYQDDHRIVPSIDVHIKTHDSVSLLFFKNLQQTSTASYKCNAKNIDGHDITSTELVVKGLIIIRLNWVVLFMFCDKEGRHC